VPGQSLWVQGITPADARLAASGVLATNSNDPGDIRQGVLYTGQQNLIGATSGLTVTVLPLHFVGSKAYSNGAYLGFNPTTATVTVPAAPTVGLKRIDVLYVVQQDSGALVSADGTTSSVFGVHPGIASSTPSKPALTDAPAAPVGAIEVGTITWDSTSSVPTATNAAVAGASCTIATTCQWTAVRGNPIPVRNVTEQTALSAYDGMCVYRLDLHAEKTHNGTSWDVPFADFYRGTGGTIPTGIGTWTVLAFPNQVAAEGSLTCTSGSFTVPVPGRYRCTGRVMFPGAAGLTTVGALLAVNGTTVDFDYASAASLGSWPAKVTRTVRLNSGDVVTFSASHNATSSLATSTDIHSTWAQVEWEGP
jgi:hypothetical protein